MSQTSHFPHFILELLKELPPIEDDKNPIIAGLIGFFFGGIGLGLYFRTWQDFLFPIIVLVMLSILLAPTIVLGPLFGLTFAALWGIVRALNSGYRAA